MPRLPGRLLLLIGFVVPACAPPQPVPPADLHAVAAVPDTIPDTVPAVHPLPDTALALWASVVTARVTGSPWTGSGRYDAANFLMVPLHAAFAGGYEDGQRAFADHARRFLETGVPVRLEPANELSWLQYLYLLSRFTALSADYGRADLIPPGLPARLREWVEADWLLEPASAYTGGPFLGGVRERVLWKLAGGGGRTSRSSYDRAILDAELFLFAIAADLRDYRRRLDPGAPRDSLLGDIARSARLVFQSRVTRTLDGGWVLQPGAWRDHPDFRYACRTEKLLRLPSCPRSDIAEDVSHSHRLPLWLHSLAAGEPPGSEGRRYYRTLLDGLENQFFERVVVAPDSSFPGWRTHNFMDGGNGIYRWEYRSLGPGQGYGPYELSGTLVFGWWGFLPGIRTRTMYWDLAGRFPLDSAALRLYAGPYRLRPGYPGPNPPAYLSDGTAELLCRLASALE